jgi:hypothetical protein
MIPFPGAQYHTTDAEGETLVAPTTRQMRRVLESLEDADEADFADVSLVHASGWCLTVNPQWLVVLERTDDSAPMRVRRVKSLEDALALWEELAAGEIEALQKRGWKEPGEA